MRFLKLVVQNIGMIADAEIPINKPLNLFYGDIRQGKTTILASVKLCYGGAFPADVLRHGTKQGLVRLEFEGGYIEREFYLDSKDGIVKARDVKFIRDGKPVPRPVEELRKMLNPFERNQNHFADMGGPERQRFFCELLGVDTGEIDTESADIKTQNQELEVKSAGFGDLDLTPVQAPDPIGLRKKLNERKAEHAATVKKLQAEHAAKVAGWNGELAGLREQWEGGKRKELKDAQASLSDRRTQYKNTQAMIAGLEQQLADAREQLVAVRVEMENDESEVLALTKEVAALPDLKPQADALKAKIEAPLELPTLDTSDIDQALQDAAANQVKYNAYLSNVEKDAQRKNITDMIQLNKERLKELKQLKAQKLAEIAEASGIPNLSFDEDGNFVFETTAASMLSTSQIMRLSQILSGLFPPGLDLSLIDRAESLGKDVMLLVEEAKRTNRTYLATVVGNRPATAPQDVGVFVVENGVVKQ